MPAFTHALARHCPSAPRSAARTAPALSAALSSTKAARAAAFLLGRDRTGVAVERRLAVPSRRQGTLAPAAASAARSASRVARAAGTSGRRSTSRILPISASPAFTGDGIGLEEVGVHERQQAILATRGRRSRSPRRAWRTSSVICAGTSFDVTEISPSPPAAATGNASQSSPESTAKPVGTVADDLHDLPQVAARLLDAAHVRVLGQAKRGGREEVDGGAAGDVVEADRADGGIGDGLEVPGEAVLRGLVVVGRGA